MIAALNGYAVGGGFEIALAADMIVAASHAEAWLPEAGIGIIPDAGGVLRLPRRVPRGLAMEVMLTGRRLGAEEGLHLGLFNRVVEPGEVMATARELARAVCASAPLSVQAIKEVVRETEGLSVEQAYAHQRSGALPAYRRMLGSEDALEGPRAFAEKREPRWQGR